jgi:protein-disulfide isomerase-like protein with CxxC motif
MEHGLTEFERQMLDGQTAIRAAIAAIQVDMEKRLSALEVHDRECYGNGQPGWRERHAAKISRLEKWTALCAGGGMMLGFLVKMGVELLHK